MPATFTRNATRHSLRQQILMEAQQKIEIGERIRELRENSAETNRSIADYVGVGERSVAAWMAGGGITYDNAKKVAELFEVDVDYIWRGRAEKPETPDVVGLFNGDETGSPRQDEVIRDLLARQTLLLTEMERIRLALQESQETLQRVDRNVQALGSG